jgi:hypothetical protein
VILLAFSQIVGKCGVDNCGTNGYYRGRGRFVKGSVLDVLDCSGAGRMGVGVSQADEIDFGPGNRMVSVDKLAATLGHLGMSKTMCKKLLKAMKLNVVHIGEKEYFNWWLFVVGFGFMTSYRDEDWYWPGCKWVTKGVLNRARKNCREIETEELKGAMGEVTGWALMARSLGVNSMEDEMNSELQAAIDRYMGLMEMVEPRYLVREGARQAVKEFGLEDAVDQAERQAEPKAEREVK